MNERTQTKLGFLAGIILLAIGLLAFGGCKTKLDPAGVYHGDTILYDADKIIVTAHENFVELYRWEKKYREVLPVEVSRAADFCRLNEEKWIRSAIALRETYKSAGTLENKDKLRLALNIVQTSLREAGAYMTALKKVAPNDGLRNVKPLTAGI